jgi:cysteine desulfurase/selenocysteine lyase
VLYGKEEHLQKLKPFLGGGGANTNIRYQGSDFQEPPAKFEAGNLNCASIIGAGVAVDYLQSMGLDRIKDHECKLNKLLTEELNDLDNLFILGPEDTLLRGGILNFYIKGVNPHDIAISIEELENILVRSGTLCAHSWFNEHLKDGVVSISFYFYNTIEEVGIFAECLKKLIRDFS